MTLQQQLDQKAAEFSAAVPQDTQDTMAKAAEALAGSGIVDQALNVGDSLPPFTLPNATGTAVNSQNLLEQGPVVITFYRGGWCPYCNLELRALQQSLPAIQQQGATLVAISPQTPDNSLSTAEKNELAFEVLSDVGNAVARQFGLVFQLPEALRPVYENFGIDLPAHNGDDAFELPLAATYVVAPSGQVVAAFVSADYRQRMEPSEIVAALEALKISA
ncbi:MAG: peroxiredoxin-like family protein [Cyanobacteria bacterium P01_A01_bin.135]